MSLIAATGWTQAEIYEHPTDLLQEIIAYHAAKNELEKKRSEQAKRRQKR